MNGAVPALASSLVLAAIVAACSSDAARPEHPGVDGGGSGSSGGAVAVTEDAMAGAGDDGSVPVGTIEAGGEAAGPASAPASCAAADVGNTPLGTDTPDPTGTAVNAITYTNVGATGSYDQVVTSTVAPTLRRRTSATRRRRPSAARSSRSTTR